MFGFIPELHISRAADELRWEALGTAATKLPIDLDGIIFDHLCQHQGLAFDDEAELGQSDGDAILGKMTVVPGKIQISRTLRSAGNEGRFRFTVAHEIGHWVLHRPLILATEEQYSLLGPTRGELITLNRAISEQTRAREEIQANMFASELLMPRKQLGAEWMQRQSAGMALHINEGDLKGAARRAATARVGGLPSLAEQFAVSAEAMALALLKRKLVAPPQSTLDGF